MRIPEPEMHQNTTDALAAKGKHTEPVQVTRLIIRRSQSVQNVSHVNCVHPIDYGIKTSPYSQG